MKTVFFYGLFMDADLLLQKGFTPKKQYIAYAPGFGLRIGERATLVKSENESAYGQIMDVDEQELEALYGDPSVQDYVPENINIVTEDGESRAVVCYNLPPSLLRGKNQEYAEMLLKIAKKIGLPQSYFEAINTFID